MLGGAHGRSTGGIGEALAFEMAQEGAQAGKAAAERAGAGAIAAAGGEEAAQIRRAQIADILEAGRSSEVLREEGEELAGVALIGIERVVGETAFV